MEEKISNVIQHIRSKSNQRVTLFRIINKSAQVSTANSFKIA